MRSAWFALMLLAADAVALPVHAKEPRFAWRGPDCATSAPLLEQRLTELVEPGDRDRLAGAVAVARTAKRYGVELTIEVDGRRLGSRRFEAKSCAEAAETAAVAASLAVYDGTGEPKGVSNTGISPDIWTKHPEAAPELTHRPRVPPARRRTVLQARVGILGALELGALPKPAGGGALALELGLGERWSLAARGSVIAEQRQPVRDQKVVFLSAVSGSGRVCLAPLSGTQYRLDGCAGAQLMQARGRGEGFDASHSATLTWAAPLLGVDFSFLAPRYLEWRWELDGSLPLSRRRFLVDGSEVSRAAVVVVGIRSGVVVRF
jgi:hypothetical protein